MGNLDFLKTLDAKNSLGTSGNEKLRRKREPITSGPRLSNSNSLPACEKGKADNEKKTGA